MADFLYECGLRSKRPGIVKPFMRASNAKYEEDKNVMLKLVDDSGCLLCCATNNSMLT